MPGFALFAAISGGWFICTFVASVISLQDQFTPQVKWLTQSITAPFRFTAHLVGAPGRLLRDYWGHRQTMKQLDDGTEKRIASLEIALADKFLESKHDS